MQKKEEIIKELEALAPDLAQIKKSEQERSQPPANFFEQLPNQLLTQMQLEPKPVIQTNKAVSRTGILSLFQIFRQPPYAIGFGVVIAIFLSVAVFKLFESSESLSAEIESAATLDDVSDQALYDYVITNIEEFESGDILEAAEGVPIDFLIPDQILEDEDLDTVIDELTEEVDWSTIL